MQGRGKQPGVRDGQGPSGGVWSPSGKCGGSI